jgi:hypothetical protein
MRVSAIGLAVKLSRAQTKPPNRIAGTPPRKNAATPNAIIPAIAEAIIMILLANLILSLTCCEMSLTGAGIEGKEAVLRDIGSTWNMNIPLNCCLREQYKDAGKKIYKRIFFRNDFSPFLGELRAKKLNSICGFSILRAKSMTSPELYREIYGRIRCLLS